MSEPSAPTFRLFRTGEPAELAIHGAPCPWEENIPLRPLRVDDPLPGLWSFAALIWYEITQRVFSGSADLMRTGYASKTTHRLLADWVRNLEKLVRRILIIAALALELKPARPLGGPWGAPRYRFIDWRDPTSWPVRFRMLDQARTPGRAKRPKPQQPDEEPWRSPARPVWAFALRIEALRRVLSSQQDCARRLARTLARIKAANAKANEPRVLTLSRWDFAPERRTNGKHAVAEPMTFADPLARETMWKWEQPG